MNGRLRLYASLWTLWGHPAPRREWPLERKVREVQAAGFEGISGPAEPALRVLADRYRLHLLGAFAARDRPTLERTLRAFADLGIERVNLQLGSSEMRMREAVSLAVRALRLSSQLGVKVSIETHRGTCTETPEKLLAVAECVWRREGQLLPITWDFSHYAVVRHLHAEEFEPRLLFRPDLVQTAGLFHFRPFNGHHAQIPTRNGCRPAPELRAWGHFVTAVMRCWRALPENASREMWACPEIGPGDGYGLASFPPAWDEARRVRTLLRRAWQDAA